MLASFTSSARSSGSRGMVSSSLPPGSSSARSPLGSSEPASKRFGGFTRERVKVTVSVTGDYHVAREAVLDLYRLVGPNWFDILIEPRVSHYFKGSDVPVQGG